MREGSGGWAEEPLAHRLRGAFPTDGVDVSWFHVAHFKDEGMVLEPPARVEPFYAVLENPSFSLMGIFLRIARGTRLSIPITSTTLVYYHWNSEEINFHLYLIPSDASLTKVRLTDFREDNENYIPSLSPWTFHLLLKQRSQFPSLDV